jgi:hypothetical protein
VNLDIREDRPIPLAEALQMIEKQTQARIRLDRSISPNVAFAARFVQTPLLQVLDAIARTGALKLVLQEDGSILLAPTDRLTILLGGAPVGVYPPQLCARCHQPLAASWRFCPNCGQAVARKGAVSSPRRNPE